MKFSKKISSRLQDRRGESLTETLVSVLIIALGLTLLASLVTAAGKLIQKSQIYDQSSTAVRNAIETGSTAAVKEGGGLKVTLQSSGGTLNFAGSSTVLTDDVSVGGNPSFSCTMATPISHAVSLQKLVITGDDGSGVMSLNGRAFTYTDAKTASSSGN